MFLGTNLLDMYAKCGTLEEACQVFDNLPNRDVVSWTALIAGYTQHAKSEIALHCFEEMQHQDIVPNAASYLSILKACSNIGALNQGRHIHQQIMSFKIQSNGYLESALVDMYAKCGSLEEACKVFAKLPNPDVVSWGTMIAGCVQNDENILAVQIFERMQNNGVNPNRATFLGILKAYGNIGDIVHGRRIHVQIIDNGVQLDIAVLNTLVDMYAKCGALEEARKLFDKMATRDVVSWGAMLGGYAQHDGGDIVLKCFNQMQNEGIRPNKVIFLSLLKACGSIGSLVRGRQMHQQIIVNGFELDIAVGNTILDVYAKFGSLEEARKVFGELPYQNVVSWNAMIAGYAQHGEGVLALNYFDKMQNLAIKPNKVTFLCILKASGNIRDIKQTTKIHDQIIKSGMLMDVALGSALIDAYAKCGILERAHKVFDKLSAGNVVSWNAIISAFLQHDRSHVVLEYFKKMQEINLEPDKVTFLGILKACSNIGAIDQGRYIHNKIKQSGIELDIVVGNAIIDMYAKCGSMKEACKVFNKLPNRDVVTWGAIIDGYGRIGNAALAFQYFYEMQQSGIKPDDITFIGILRACSHMGLLQEAYRYFISMTENHGVTPRTAHYNCMIDLFSHAGCFKEAEDLFSPHQDNICGLITLLSACRMHGNVELGRQCFHKVVC